MSTENYSISAAFPEPLARRFRVEAARRCVSMSALLRGLAAAYCDDPGRFDQLLASDGDA